MWLTTFRDMGTLIPKTKVLGIRPNQTLGD
jgi:hypothetical protein